MIVKLEQSDCFVQRVPNNPDMLHVDGDCLPNSNGLPPWIWESKGWTVSTCGLSRVFMFKQKI